MMTKLQLFRLSYSTLTIALVISACMMDSSTSVFTYLAWCLFLFLAMQCWIADLSTKPKKDPNGC